MSKIYFTSDWDNLYVYIFGSYTPEQWPGKLLVKNSDSDIYEMDVTGYENESLVIHDNGSNQLSDNTVASLINKILDTTSGSIVDYNADADTDTDQDTQESEKVVTVKNLKKFLEKTDIRYASTTYSAGSNLSLDDTTFNVSDTPSFTDITISGYKITVE